MSTYNGGERIYRQVKSIFNQKGVSVSLVIRDDGSNDETIQVLKRIENEYESNLKVVYGANIGYKKSFLTLLSIKGDADYYSFSDQDDLWEEDKLISAVKLLDRSDSRIKLYTSSIGIYNENLVKLKISDIGKVPNGMESLFTRTRFAGCTFVFSEELASMVSGYEKLSYKDNEMPDHDFLVAAFAYAYGEVIIDCKSYIKHIRYDDSVTSGGNGLKKRIRVELYNTFRKKNIRLHMAQLLLKYSSDNGNYDINNDVFNYLMNVSSYKKSFINRVRFIRSQKVDCGSGICNFETKVKILMGKF